MEDSGRPWRALEGSRGFLRAQEDSAYLEDSRGLLRAQEDSADLEDSRGLLRILEGSEGLRRALESFGGL